MKVGVVGASGYAGGEALRLLSGHPVFDVVVATGQRHLGERVAHHTPSLSGSVGELVYQDANPDALGGLDVVFIALPHGASQSLVPALTGSVGAVIDLGADFRLDPAIYEQWYGEAHKEPDLCGRAVYGLVERHREELVGASLVAVPGCYPTAATLALAPFFDRRLLETNDVIVDAASGTSGAGRVPGDHLHFSHVDGGFSAYGLLSHRHTPEIEKNLGASVLFTPHLVPMARGMLVTAYARTTSPIDSLDALDILHEAYDAEPFIHVVDEPPSTKWAHGSNSAFVTARVDERSGRIVALCAIDNLGKGAAGQAVQCANVIAGLDETAGLSVVGVYP